MKLCMFHPTGHPLERGWVGRIDGDRVVHLAAQTLQSFFTGGGSPREHAEYPLDQVVLLAPVLHPPAVRVFTDQAAFAFANPAAIVGPHAVVHRPPASGSPRDDPSRGLGVALRVAAVIGAEEEIAGFTGFAEWRDGARPAPKDRDFALGLGPIVVTVDASPSVFEGAVRVRGESSQEARLVGFDWAAARALAAEGTRLVAGDLLVSPVVASVDGIEPGGVVELAVEGIGALEQRAA